MARREATIANSSCVPARGSREATWDGRWATSADVTSVGQAPFVVPHR